MMTPSEGTRGPVGARRIARWATWVAVALVMGPGGPARAQVLPVPLPELATKAGDLAPGTWASYAMRRAGAEQAHLVRMAALDTQDRGQWFEFSLVGPLGRGLVIRALVEGRLTEPKRVRSAVVQMAGQQPLAVPPEMLDQQLSRRSPRKSRDATSQGKRVGRSRVRVPAGVFRAAHYRRRDHEGRRVDVWISREGKGWPLLKVSSAELSLEMVGRGTGAKSQIRGTPVPMDARLLQAFGGFLK